ncbi:MAG: MoxR family ATPase [Thermoleophilia bacterium]|nr:MoxR family ATPase [Thermoleophilia bacterium]
MNPAPIISAYGPASSPSASASVRAAAGLTASLSSTRVSPPPASASGAGSEQAVVDGLEESRSALEEAGYLADDATALVSHLARRLDKPVLVEGPAGVGKTELAKALARATGRELIRLQCYEGLDEAKALYEWNYRKQLLRIQAEASAADPDGAAPGDAVMEDIFGEEFLLTRPLLAAIASREPVVLLIDEIDKTDQEFEAMLLEVLSDFQISIPELGVVEAQTMPLVLLTSNNSRELTEALKRRCLYLWLDYPAVEREVEIVRLHAPDLDEQLARRLVEVVGMVRELDLKKPPSIAESIDWARALLLLGVEQIDADTFARTMSIIVKHRTDLDLVAERVGMRLPAAPRAAAPGDAATAG